MTVRSKIQKNPEYFAGGIAVGVVAIAIAVRVVIGIYAPEVMKKEESDEDDIVVCTQEVQQCSDGSFVSRIPPDCSFEECPVAEIGTLPAEGPFDTPAEEETKVKKETVEEIELYYPMPTFTSDITKKSFGLYVSPGSSPVSNERFTGYHTAVDIESSFTGGEDVPVYAIADGTITLKLTASGYGGVMMTEHIIDSKTYSVVYGHVKLSSAPKGVGQSIDAGERLAFLGEGFSTDTDGERKHLHFGLIPGSSTNIRGYVANQSDLVGWIDPKKFYAEKEAAKP
ncbi:M23 family metallopeptidase [Patescibacteria group bacterium]